MIGSTLEKGSTNNFGTIPNIPKKYQPAVRGGINFFELRWLRPIKNVQFVYGPYDLTCGENWNTAARRTDFWVNWRKEADAHIRYIPGPEDVAVAWMPDDPYWRNRIFMMDTYAIFETLWGYHTKEGYWQRSYIQPEIEAMVEVLKHKVKRHTVLRSGKEIDHFATKKEALYFIETKEEIKQIIDPKTQQIRAIRPKHKYTTGTVEALEYKDEIRELIKREHGRHAFGWTESQFFLKEIRPQIDKTIIKKREESQSKALGLEKLSFMEQLKSLTPEERQTVASMLVPQAKPSNDDDAEFVPKDVNPDDVMDPWEKRAKTDYHKMNKEKLVKIYGGRGGDPEGKTIVTLIDELYGQDQKESSPSTGASTEPKEIVT